MPAKFVGGIERKPGRLTERPLDPFSSWLLTFLVLLGEELIPLLIVGGVVLGSGGDHGWTAAQERRCREGGGAGGRETEGRLIDREAHQAVGGGQESFFLLGLSIQALQTRWRESRGEGMQSFFLLLPLLPSGCPFLAS